MQNLWKPDDFIHEFYKQLPKHPTQTAAYIATEELCIAQNGRRKYSDFDSFRQVLKRHIQRKANLPRR